MCGISGFIDTSTRQTADGLREVAERMTAALVHRGPDDQGVWVDAKSGVALGHRRLSVVDLSSSGRQPMVSSSGRFVMVYNGEVYNHAELRKELSAHTSFRGHCDTEVLLEAIDRWGLVSTLQRANGMFALALWDSQLRQLFLARDRLGIKPVYYGWSGSAFVFASELKALRAVPEFRNGVDRVALSLFLQHSYVPAPYTIYTGIRKLPPGTWLPVAGNREAKHADPTPYWSMLEVARAGVDRPFAGSQEEAVDELQRLLADAVGTRMQADVPLGAFLSGGVDSSAVVALMRAQSGSATIKTFCIGFEEPAYNEAEYARAIAAHLETDHTTLVVTPREARDVIPRLAQLFDEPFADSSQIPTYLVSQLARQDVTVSLSGDGGDELFGGYERYAFVRRFWRRAGWLPRQVRGVISRGLQPFRKPVGVGRKLGTLADFLAARDAQHFYTRFHTHWKRPQEVVIGGRLSSTPFYNCAEWARRDSLLESMMYVDSITYLPDDILTKVDRVSMGVSLEARVPLLDHRVVEFAWSLPTQCRVHRGESKRVLRQLLARFVPPAMMQRPKVGFGVPIGDWLRGPLRDWAAGLLDEQRLRREGFFRPAAIQQKWEKHLTGQQDWHYYLWDVLMFQLWLENQSSDE